MTLQHKWRVAGISALSLAAVMVWQGAARGLYIHSIPVTLIYWLFMLLLLFIAFYSVLLDLRYTRLQHKISRRELFRQAFDTEEFRKIIAARRPSREEQEKTQPKEKDKEE